MEIILLIKTHILKPCFKGIEPNVIHPETNVDKIWKMPVCPRVPLLDGKSEIGAQLWSEFGNLIWIRHVFRSTAVAIPSHVRINI